MIKRLGHCSEKEIIKLIEDDVKAHCSTSVIFWIHKITSWLPEIPDNWVDKICGILLQNGEYVKTKRDFSKGYDYDISVNSYNSTFQVLLDHHLSVVGKFDFRNADIEKLMAHDCVIYGTDTSANGGVVVETLTLKR